MLNAITLWHRLKNLRSLLLILPFLLVLSHCRQGDPPVSATKDVPPDAWAHRAWIAKAGRSLQAGVPLRPVEIESLASMGRAEVVDHLLAQAGFADTALDFNLFYLGVKPVQLYETNGDGQTRRYSSAVYSKPQAIAAAQEVMHDGDVWRLLDDEQARFIPPLQQAFQSGAPDGPYDRERDQANREAIFQKSFAALATLNAAFHRDDGAGLDKDKGCRFLRDTKNEEFFFQVTGTFEEAGFDEMVVFDLSYGLQPDLMLACGDPALDANYFVNKFAALQSVFQHMLASSSPFLPTDYLIRSVMDIKALPPMASPLFTGSAYTASGFWFFLVNSSTNYNRKRAAYMLKTYFCDDLTPINIVAPDADHAGDRHASDPSCQACHYKLDPMAGFFVDRGVGGQDFHGRSLFLFDDGALLQGDKRQAYAASWPSTGYVRSMRNPAANDYGKTLADLSAIMRRAPEVRQCLVRRMAEYFLGKDQVFDGGWLAHLEQNFTTSPSSGQAFKAVVKELMLSRTFQEPDPVPDQCYDRVPGSEDNGLPCAVAHVLRNNCASCHSHISSGRKGLDLTRWVAIGQDAQGVTIMGFPHQDANGQQRSRHESFAIIAERLSSTNPELAMPYKRDMPAADRARLYKWLMDSPHAMTEE